MAIISPIRPSPIAGTWYEGNPKSLARAVDAYMDQAKLPELPGRVVAVVAPHAGHIYSGAVAGHAFAAIRGRNPDRVAVIAPMHQLYYEPLLTTAHEAYSTPLGNILVDREALEILDRELNQTLGHGITPVPHDREHSLEIELPFLQRAMTSNFKLIPIMIRTQSKNTAAMLGRALANLLKDQDAILVASTDLSHFYDQKIARELDNEMLHCIGKFDADSIFIVEASGRGQACGHAAVATVLWAAQELGADMVKVLNYATSGDVTGDTTSVVGYGAAAVLKTQGL